MRKIIVAITAGILLTGCLSTKKFNSYFINTFMNTEGIDKHLICDTFDIENYEKNCPKNNWWEYELPDGTKIEKDAIDLRWQGINLYYEMKIFPPKPKFYQIIQLYYENGKIWKRGKTLGGSVPVGEWEYYDPQGNKTIVNEDSKFGAFNYNEIYLYLHRHGYIDVYTGENRENLSLYFHEEKGYWTAAIKNMEKRIRDKFYFDKDTGKVRRVKYVLSPNGHTWVEE
jgi:hypothetical protein